MELLNIVLKNGYKLEDKSIRNELFVILNNMIPHFDID